MRGQQRMLKQLRSDFNIPVSKLWLVADDLVSDMRKSLLGQSQTNFVMLPSHTFALPNGTEEGLYYAMNLNLQEDNFVMLCTWLGGKNQPIPDVQNKVEKIPSEVIHKDSQELFDYIASCLAVFISENKEKDTIAPKGKLGFTVSVPLVDGPTAMSKEKSVERLRSFKVNDTVGKELAQEVNKALEKHGINLRVSSLIDATLGVLARGRYYNTKCVAAVTLEKSTNAVYVESAQLNPNEEGDSRMAETVIDLQWSNFNSQHLPKTKFDIGLDSESSNPGSCIFEKLIGGIYLAEVVRRAMLKMAEETGLFGEIVPAKLKNPYSLRVHDMIAMHKDTSPNFDIIHQTLTDVFEITDTSYSTRYIVSEICSMIANRGARLAGACIVGILTKHGRINDEESLVNIESEFYKKDSCFRNYIRCCVWDMLKTNPGNVLNREAHGGYGVGAIFVAAAQQRGSTAETSGYLED